MGVFEIEANGKVYEVEAPSAEDAARAFSSSGQSRSWSDVPLDALKNTPESAVRFAQNVVYPFLHPIDTVKGIYSIGEGLGSKAVGALGFDQDPSEKAQTEASADAVGQFFKDRYGGMDELKNTLATDPIGAMADTAAVLTGGAALPGRVGTAAKAAARAVDPVVNAGRLARGTGKIASAVTGVATGTGSMPIEQAFRAGRSGSQVFVDNMRGNAPATDVLEMAKSAVSEYGKDRGAAYRAGRAAVFAGEKPLSYAPVIKAVTDAKEMISYKGKMKSKDAARVYDDIYEYILWYSKDPATANAEGFDALKQAVGEIRQKTQYGTLERKVADNIFNAIKNEIVKQAPDYAKVMRDYAKASESMEDLTKTFSLGEKASKDTAIRKLTSTMRNNVNTNFGERARLLDELAKKEPELPNAVAGQALNSLTPRGLNAVAASGAAGYGLASNPAALAMLPATSPRLVGEAAYAMGRGAGGLDRMSPVLTPAFLNAVKSYLVGQTAQQANEPKITTKDVERLLKAL